MRVGILTYRLDRPLGGISRYTMDLVRSLTHSKNLDIHLLAAGGTGVLEKTNLPTTKLIERGFLPILLSIGNIKIPVLSKRLNLDIIHDPTGVLPVIFGASGAKIVVTIHDVIPLSFPGYSTLLDSLIYRYWLPLVLRNVDGVITDSYASKEDIIRFLDVSEEHVYAIHIGVKPDFIPSTKQSIQQVKEKYNLPERYILFIGSSSERKNLSRLLIALKKISHNTNIPHKLVVSGVTNWQALPAVKHLVESNQLNNQVVFTGYIEDTDLPALYTGSDLFVFPSLYEGFGLPVLEAMACGTPVITSNVSSLPEVAGDAAVMIDPYDTDALAEAMQDVLTSSEMRESMINKGFEHAKKFSWEKTAFETERVYRAVLRL